MDSKEIKVLLKQAREAIREKEHKAALKHCKAVLKIDKHNYNAWVFIGVAAQEMEQPVQAEAAFQKAIEIAPDQYLAWQGLCHFYEKVNCEENQKKLIEPYHKMIELLKDDKSKQLEIMKKLCDIYKTLNFKEKFVEILKLRIEMSKGNIIEEYNSWIAVVEIFENEKELTLEEEILLEKAYSELAKSTVNDNEESKIKIFEKHLQFLLKKNKTEEVSQLCKIFMKRLPESSVPLEYLCQLAVETYIEKEIILEDTQSIAECLFRKTKSLMSCLAIGIVFFSKKCYLEAIAMYKLGLENNPNSSEGWFLITNGYLSLYKYHEAKLSASAGLKQLSSIKNSLRIYVRGMLYLYLAKSLVGQQLWSQALPFLDKVTENIGRTPQFLEVLSKILLKTNEIKKAEKVCEELKQKIGECMQALCLEGAICISQRKYSEAETKLNKAIEFGEDNVCFYLLGILHWEKLRITESFHFFMKAAKLDPYYSRNFLYLGHHYTLQKDSMKALRCYKKAFELDIYDEDVGASFSDLLRDMGEHETNLQLLKKVTEEAPVGSAKWARIRLGLYYLQHNDTTAAINALQSALHCDLSDSLCWETIGDAYFERGSYESALKSFKRASELNPSNLHCHYWMAQILLITGVYSKAIEEFKNILELESSYVAAFKGLAEALLYQARSHFDECLFGRFKDDCQETITVLSRAVMLQPHFSCLWKLLGDAFTLPATLDMQYFPFSIPGYLVKANTEIVTMNKCDMLLLGERFYHQSLTTQPKVSGLWHDLGINYYYQAKHSRHEEEAKLLAEKSLLCVEQAIIIDPSDHTHWTTLGVIASCNELKNYSLTQHAFIKSIQCEPDNAPAWTNLGILYIIHNNIQLTHEVFKVAQKLDPSYPICWIGQALVAEAVNHGETLDLFRHATTLGNHPECLIGYGQWVCNALKNTSNRNSQWYMENIEEMDAISVALDCLIKYCSNKGYCPIAYNMLGILFERQFLYRESLRSFERSTFLLKEKKLKLELQTAHANCGRLFILNEEFKEAINCYLSISNHDVSSFCGLALAYYKEKNYNKSDQVFQEAIKLATSEKEQLCIVTARAMIARKMKDSKAKILLLESFQSKSPCIEGLQALYALALLDKDNKLAKEILKQLQVYQQDQKCNSLISYLSSLFWIIQNNTKFSKIPLCRALHNFPRNPQLWSYLAMNLLQWQKGLSSVALKCMEIANCHTCDASIISPLMTVCHLMNGNIKSALQESQKSLHLRPDLSSNWMLFITSCCRAGIDKTIEPLYNFAYKSATIK